jgi:hypothetical protein
MIHLGRQKKPASQHTTAHQFDRNEDALHIGCRIRCNIRFDDQCFGGEKAALSPPQIPWIAFRVAGFAHPSTEQKP